MPGVRQPVREDGWELHDVSRAGKAALGLGNRPSFRVTTPGSGGSSTVRVSTPPPF